MSYKMYILTPNIYNEIIEIHTRACAVINNDYRHMNWNILIENITPNYQTRAEYFLKKSLKVALLPYGSTMICRS